MTAKHFAKLSDALPRDAWPNEARDFTPWLSDNIDYLSEAIGIELEATEVEVAVDSFSADVIAKVAGTEDRVLIENQLEGSDHRHLGQIMTYLAGLDAKCIVWIARHFHEAHRSAIRWLNENTRDGFAFFAVRVRVVRIGDSPFAPVFEVVEKPNAWERALGGRANEAEAELTGVRKRFWDSYLAKHPDTFPPARTSSVWVPMPSDGTVVLSMYVASRTCGMFLRGPRGVDHQGLDEFMARHAAVLEEAFGPSQPSSGGYYYTTSIDIPLRAEDRWDELIEWMEKQRSQFVEVFKEIESSQ